MIVRGPFAKRVVPPIRTRGVDRAPSGASALVVGGGIAGLAAATVLAERGVRVTVLERESFLGGRAGSWPDVLADGTPFQMERGFHGFFRQYYNLRALLARVDPALSCLAPLGDYPLLGPNGARESFADLPRRAPFNVVELVRRSPSLTLRDLRAVAARPALAMLAYDAERTYTHYDGVDAGAYLDSLRFPEPARGMLFDVFSHSFFNPEEELSAAELLMAFHFYFMGNPEGLVFDVARDPFSRAIWEPLRRRLEAEGAVVRTATTVRRVEREGARYRVVLADGSSLVADVAVLAVEVPALQRLVDASPSLDDVSWRARVARAGVTLPFAVLRLWLDRQARRERAPFAGTAGLSLLDNVSLYERFEEESRAWSARTAGSVVELHAYAVPEHLGESAIREDLLAGLHAVYPELAGARVLDERFLLRRDCPSFAPGAHKDRLGVPTPFAGLALAGDFANVPFPSALMERAASSGMLAANDVLALWRIREEPLFSVPPRGMLAGFLELIAA